MGVTGNAILLLGYISSAVSWPRAGAQPTYELVDLDAAAGTQTVRHLRSGNTYRVSVVQLEGTE